MALDSGVRRCWLWTAGLVVNVAATLSFLCGCFVLYWIHLDRRSGRTQLGLWEVCYDCHGLHTCTSIRQISIPDWYRLMQLYVCLAFLVIVVNLVLRLQSAHRQFRVVSIVLDYVTAFLGLQAALVCGNKRDQLADEFGDGEHEATASFHFGFAFDIVGCVLFLVSALVFTVGRLQTQWDGPPRARQSITLFVFSEPVRVETLRSESEKKKEEV